VIGVVWFSAAMLQLWLAKRSADAALDDLRDIREVATADENGFVDALVTSPICLLGSLRFLKVNIPSVQMDISLKWWIDKNCFCFSYQVLKSSPR
jgi:hypothetical protein